MRVLHSTPPMGPSYGGPFESVRNLAIAQALAGIDVQAFMPWGKEAINHANEWDPVQVTISGRIQLSVLGWSPGFGKKLLQTSADVLHTHGLWMHPSWVALGWKRRHSRPHLVSVRGMLEDWAWNHHRWKKLPVWWALERRNLESASLLHATSVSEAEALRRRGLRSPIAVIPNGVRLPQHPGLTRTHESTEFSRTALFLSRIHPKKGLPLLFEAWSKVRPKGWLLKIVGPDDNGHRKELERQVLLLGLQNCVQFSGMLTGEAKTNAFYESSLFILPSHSENFGISIAEALAHGLPVITTTGTPWASLDENCCGWWVPASVDGLATALQDALALSPIELSAMGLRGRDMVSSRFSWSHIAQQFNDCYLWTLGCGPKPECVSV